MDACSLIIGCTICAVILFLALFHINRTMHFYVKLICYYVVVMLVAGASIPLSMLRPGNPSNLLYTAWMAKKIVSPLFGIHWNVKNVERLKSSDPCVLVCNHQSALDITGMMSLWPLFHPCVPVLKLELLYSGPFGIFCWLAGCIFVDRFNSQRAKDTLNAKVCEMKEKMVKLWIFPEGTRNDDGTLLPFKKGAFHIAVGAQIPIVPVVFSSYSDFYDIKQRKFTNGVVTVNVLPWVSTEGLTVADIPDLVNEVRSSMYKCFKGTSVKQEAESNGATQSIKKDE